MNLTPAQQDALSASANGSLFLSGAAGRGKTTVGVGRLLGLIGGGAPAGSILVLTPQRTLQEPYQEALRDARLAPGGEVTLATLGGLARRTVELFWPLVPELAGFALPEHAPTFLTLETAQYYMAHLVRPLLEQGYFESITIDRNRLYAQILDNLNKSAAVGFPYTEIGPRLTAAWIGDPAQRRVYADTQDCAARFREFCLRHNLLDFSLQLEVFAGVLWRDETVRSYLTRAYRHLIYDNVEEDVPVAHDLLAEWLPEFESALIIHDEKGGVRRFLGADPESALRFAGLCAQRAVLEESLVQDESVQDLERGLVDAVSLSPSPLLSAPDELALQALEILPSRFYPEMMDQVAAEVHRLVNADDPDQRVPPTEIVILAPYLSDALRFSMMSRLEAAGIPARSHRPSRSLRDEPAAQALLTLAALAHPHWNVHPARFDVTYAWMLALDADLVRAQLLAEITYRAKELSLSTFEQINGTMQERVTFALGGRYSRLRDWLLAYREMGQLPLDFFLRKLFGEILSQPGFGFHHNLDAARVAASLIESVRKFRTAMEPSSLYLDNPAFDLGREYLAMLADGVIAAQYLEGYRAPDDEAVLVAPAYTFLMMNRPVTVQFWIDAGASGWTERLSQPLTQPYVLSRAWTADQLWTDADEVAAESDALARLIGGLLRRCRTRLYLGLTDLGENGFEQRGSLLRAFQQVLQSAGD